MSGEANITNVRKEDKEFIRIVTGLAPDKMALIKGIVIGLQLQENSPNRRHKQPDNGCKHITGKPSASGGYMLEIRAH